MDWYLDHVAQQHVTSREGGQLEREGSETAEGTIRWGLNHQYRWPEPGDNFQPCGHALVNPPEEGQTGISVRWQMRQLVESIHGRHYPRDLQADVPPTTDGKRRHRRSGVKLRARRERAAQRAHHAPSSTATSCSSSSKHTSWSDQEAMLKHLLRGMRPKQTTLQTHRGAALSFEDAVSTPQATGEDGAECWTFERIQRQYRREGRSKVQYDCLPTMRKGHSPAGWDAWGRPWAFMNVTRQEMPEGDNTWYHTLAGGRVLIAVLVHFDQEPYFFPSAKALLQALQRNVCDQEVEITPPTREGWTTNTQYQVEALLRPMTYPPCETVMNILRWWNGFAYSGQGYRDAVPMPTGNTSLTLLDESWDSPTKDFSALEDSADADLPQPGADSGEEQASNLTLDEQWMAVHGIPAPAWAEVGFAGIKADMARRSAATQGTKEEITLYCPPRNWDPRHQMRAHLDARFPGTRVTVVRPADYPEGHPVPAHALPRFQGNPLDNYSMCGPVPEWLRGYWTVANQSPSWRGESTNDIFRQEIRLRNIIMGYAARTVRHMTTYEYRTPRELYHGLAILHEEMSSYLVPPMLEDAAELLKDFVVITEALSTCRVQIRVHENQSAHSHQEARNVVFLRAEEGARLKRELNEART